MTEHKVVTTDAEIEKALKNARKSGREIMAKEVAYVAGFQLIIVSLSDGRRLVLPVENLQGLEQASAEQLSECELVGGGTGISFPALDADFYVPALIEGVYGTRRWMAELGREGGVSGVDAKRPGARQSGARGGRSKKAAEAA